MQMFDFGVPNFQVLHACVKAARPCLKFNPSRVQLCLKGVAGQNISKGLHVQYGTSLLISYTIMYVCMYVQIYLL